VRGLAVPITTGLALQYDGTDVTESGGEVPAISGRVRSVLLLGQKRSYHG
jgi:hypothetical protein